MGKVVVSSVFYCWGGLVTIRTVLTMGLMLVLLGCAKVTLENYNKITMGMSYEEVTRLIGPPEQCDDLMGVRSCMWGDDTRSINVNFVSGKVLLFSSRNLQ
jgi:hypothetical protein